MKKITVLLCLLVTQSLAEAQIVNTKPLKGAWREISRTRSGQKISFTDTLFFEVVSSNLCIWGKSSPEAPRVRLKQIGTTLIIGPEEFDIVAQENDRMTLSADEGVEIVMQRYSNKKPPVVHNNNLRKNPRNNPNRNGNNIKFRPPAAAKMGTVPDRIEPFVGIWKCYKRTSVKPVPADQKYRLLRLVEIVESGDVITAKLYGFEDLEAQPSWVVQNYENGILYSSGKDDRPFKVINCQENELVIENEGVVYYMNKMPR